MKVRLDALLVHLWLAALYAGTSALARPLVGLVLAIIGAVAAR